MKIKFGMLVGVLLAGQLLVGGAYASSSTSGITNGDFETTPLGYGWTFSKGGLGSDGGSTVSYGSTSYPVTVTGLGLHTAKLTATASISQTILWNAGDTLTFQWYYKPMDNHPDAATVQVGSTVTTLATSNGYTGSGWYQYSQHFNANGTGILVFSSDNSPASGDKNRNDSILYVDNVKIIPSAVPIPGSALLLGSSVLGLLGIGSRRNRG